MCVTGGKVMLAKERKYEPDRKTELLEFYENQLKENPDDVDWYGLNYF